MKRLYLLRHAQAAPSDGCADRERALSSAGLADAAALGRAMAKKSYAPDSAYCSPALRTQTTLEQLCAALSIPEITYEKSIYDGTCGDLFSLIHAIPDTVNSSLIVGHNPVIHELAGRLVDENADTLMNRLAAGYKPGSLSVFECPVEEWGAIGFYQNRLIDFLEPLDYNAPATPARWT